MELKHVGERLDNLATPLPDQAAVSADGVDLTLIRWMLSLTPDERLDVLDQFVSEILELRDGETTI